MKIKVCKNCGTEFQEIRVPRLYCYECSPKVHRARSLMLYKLAKEGKKLEQPYEINTAKPNWENPKVSKCVDIWDEITRSKN